MNYFLDSDGLKVFWDLILEQLAPPNKKYTDINSTIPFKYKYYTDSSSSADQHYLDTEKIDYATLNKINRQYCILVVNSDGTGYEWKPIVQVLLDSAEFVFSNEKNSLSETTDYVFYYKIAKETKANHILIGKSLNT